MDTEATLREMREIKDRAVNLTTGAPIHDLVRMAELFEALDEWLSKGGFLPADWAGAR